MASDIDITQPPFGNATTAGVRANFATAKAEIEALQQQIGYVDYNDANTGVTPIAVSPSTWTKMTNDTLGPQTRVRLPVDVTALWNAVTNQMDLTSLPVDSMLVFRADMTVTTTAANQILKFRASMSIGGVSPYTIEGTELQFKTAGAHKLMRETSFYIGSEDMRNHPAELQLWSDAACTVRVNGWYIQVTKNLTT